jgi:hypothetical protein
MDSTVVVFRKRNRIIGNSVPSMRNRKLEVMLLVKATQALLFDQEIGNKLWRNAIFKRLKNESLH